MNVILIPSSVGTEQEDQNQFVTSYLINDTVAIDAGCLGFYRDAFDQARVKHVFLSHTHIDHIASLPVFVENAYEGKAESVVVHATAPVLDSLHRDLFNDRVWPDFIALSKGRAPFLRLERLEPGRPVEVEGLKITPIDVDHIVPTVGFLVEEEDGRAVLISSDTGPTEEIWRRGRAVADLRAVFLEVTFPDELAWLAEVSKHLTPSMFAQELAKLGRPVEVIAVHIKPRYREKVVSELHGLGLPKLQIGRFGPVYQF